MSVKYGGICNDHFVANYVLSVAVKETLTRNSSADERANVNFLYDYIVRALGIADDRLRQRGMSHLLYAIYAFYANRRPTPAINGDFPPTGYFSCSKRK